MPTKKNKNPQSKSKRAKPPPRPSQSHQQQQQNMAKANSQPYKPRNRNRKPRDLVARLTAPQALAYLDPKDKTDPPHSSTTLGNFVTLNSVSRATLTTNTSMDLYVICQWTATDMSFFFVNDGSPWAVGVYKCPMLTAQSPISIRPLRCSINVRNTTQAINAAGLVRVMNMPQSYDWSAAFATSSTLLAATVADIKGLVEGSPMTHTATAQELTTGRTWIQYPVSTIGYNTWQEYLSNAQTGTQNSLVTSSRQETMSTIIMQFPATPSGTNTLEFTVRRQDAVRYAANSAISSTARAPPLSNPMSTEVLIRAASTLAPAPVEGMTTTAAYNRARQILEGGATALSVVSAIGRTVAAIV